MLRSCLVAVVGLASTLGAAATDAPRPSSPDAAAPSAERPAPKPLLDRVALLGASATAGFNVTVDTEIDGSRYPMPIDLGDVLTCARRDGAAPAAEAASFLFFTSPRPMGAMFTERTATAEPTLVIAIDYLFWYGYGLVEGTEIESRLALLEEGLANLDRLPCPIIVGDFPDMSQAIGQMLVQGQVPSPAALEALNERLRRWAQERPRVRLFALSEFVLHVRTRQPITVGGHTWSADRVGELLQTDRLHPTLEGLVAIAMRAGEIAATMDPAAPADGFSSDPDGIKACLRAGAETKARRRLEQRRPPSTGPAK